MKGDSLARGAPGWGIALLRVTLGVIFVMHGHLGLMVLGPAAIAGYTTRMGFPSALAPALAWYLVIAHLVGGVCLVLGAFTRWAALAQVPIMASATFLLHFRQGFFMRVVTIAGGATVAGGYEYSLLVLVGAVVLALTGGGTLTLTGNRR